MNGIHLSLLIAGGLAVGVPILLHLMMRQKPQHAIFPALRFIKKQREQNQRQLRLRHWLLLLLRCLAVLLAVAALALANLSVAAGFATNWVVFGVLAGLLILAVVLLIASIVDQSGALAIGTLAAIATLLFVGLMVAAIYTIRSGGKLQLIDQRSPVAAAIIVDTSMRMQYQRENTTHLKKAREMADWLVGQLPRDSQIAVVDSRPGEPAFAVDESAARRDIERLRPASVTDRLPRVIERSLAKLAASELERKEMYILTDLTAPAWRDTSSSLAKMLADNNVLVYVIDVGADEMNNFSLGDLKLSAEAIAENGRLVLSVDVRRQGEAGERNVELFVEKTDTRLPRDVDGQRQLPEAEVRRTKQAKIGENASTLVTFPPLSLEAGTTQGYVKLAGSDPLAVDDIRYFTIDVRQSWSVLAVAPENVKPTFFVEAIAPTEFRQTGRSRYQVKTIDQNRLPAEDLADYSVICLLDPQPLTPSEWEKLAAYVNQGGSLAVFLGHNTDSNSLADESAQVLLPGEVRTIPFRSPERNIFLAPQQLGHPVLAPFRDISTTVPWQAFPVFLHWDFKTLNANAQVIARFSNGKPAAIETKHGEGKVITLATPVTDPSPRRGARKPWNEFAYGENNWPPFILVNEITRYLASSQSTRLNFFAGEAATIVNNPARDPEEYTLFAPDQPPEPKKAIEERVFVSYTENLGAYRLKGNRGGPVVRGFAVNLPAAETQLTRIDRDTLDTILGQDAYRFATDQEEIQRDQGEARAGSGLYPYFLAALAMILAFEHLLGNRFYQKR